jgi:hypothetical protein
MLLLTDGSVMVQELETSNWWLFTPNVQGDYLAGTWSQIASMPNGYAPTYYASAVLPDGRVIVEGGEYNGDSQVETNQGAIYNPVTNTWTTVNPPPGWTEIGDATSTVLSNGQFMMGSCATADVALLNATTLTWTVLPAIQTGKADANSEEGWSLLPNGDVLTVDTENTKSPRNTEIFAPSTGKWTSAGDTPLPLVNSSAVEIGPQLLQPDGNVFAAGATGDNAIYDTATGKWSAAPSFPVIGGQQYDIADGPAAVLPDGNVLLDASRGVYEDPAHFFVYNGKTLTQVADPPDASVQPSYTGRMLVLPTGQILFNDLGNLELYNDAGQPQEGWAPNITKVTTTLDAGSTYTVSGTQLNGLTQGSAYGDDYQSATNYPLVRITNDATGDVAYAPTSGMTSMSVSPGTMSSAKFIVPAGIESGPSSLVVVANGIASTPVSVTVDVIPGQPVIGTAAGGNRQATVAFSPPTSDGGSPISSYTLTAIDVSNPANGGQTASSSSEPITVTGLTNGDSYFFTVKATNSVGTGPATSPSNAVVPSVTVPAWAIQPTPDPAAQSVLNAVSCTSASECTAVGFSENNGVAAATLAEAWNGKKWTIEAIANPDGSQIDLASISCSAATTCVAVGSYVDRYGTRLALAETWNGKTWTIEATPTPVGSSATDLMGVSCTSATACFAVGTVSGQSPVAEFWNGKTWTIEPTAHLPFGGTLSAVSCTSVTACTAVGNYEDKSGVEVTLAESWDGRAWVMKPTPNPTGAQFTLFSGVSCTSATACMAVGEFANSASEIVAMAEAWNGKTWTIEPTPNPPGTNELNAVSCTARTVCTAVGTYFPSTSNGTLAYAWNGKTWAFESTSSLSGADFRGLSCTSGTACTGVGNYGYPSYSLTLVEHHL